MWSEKLSDNFEQERDTFSLKMSDIFKLMFNKPECTRVVREGDSGFDSLVCDFGEHPEFFIVTHVSAVYIIAAGYTYAEVVLVR